MTTTATPSRLAQHFEELFRARPRIFRAPGRVNLIGEHTDYNEGFVMPAAVGFSNYVAAAPRDDHKLVLHSEEFSDHFSFDVDALPPRRTGAWCDYLLGVATVLQQKGVKLRGANVLLHGEVPSGAGLSSSAALEVASALAFLNLAGAQMPLPEVALVSQRAENDFVGARCGIMDQFVSCMGKSSHALLLDCRTLSFQLVPVPAGIRLVVCNTMVKHDLATGAYNQRREECEESVRYFSRWDPKVRALRDVSVALLEQHLGDLPPTIAKRSSHVVREIQRTLDAARALTDGDLTKVGKLMHESHASLRDLYEVSCQELDIMVEAAENLPGFCGGRMTGGGFGGCTINLVREEHVQDFAKQIAARYRERTAIDPQVYLCSAENGAEELKET